MGRTVNDDGPGAGEPATRGAVSAPAPAGPIVVCHLDPSAARPSTVAGTRAVAEARDLVRRGALEKVVLAREVVVEGDAPFPVRDLLARLRASYPAAFRFAVD
ncbi:MAG TPA: hypothetical protein VE395_11715, partial [Acidimicrobiales bacterium]|nr:hypothetical protein [Acidimicrobiales bacterium]